MVLVIGSVVLHPLAWAITRVYPYLSLSDFSRLMKSICDWADITSTLPTPL
jgi:hypothetical protein